MEGVWGNESCGEVRALEEGGTWGMDFEHWGIL